MKNILQTIILFFVFTSCQAQGVDGIWMSYQNYTIDINSPYTSGNEGVLIDFDNQTIGNIYSDSITQIKIDLKKSKLLIKTDTLKIDFKVFDKDSIEIDFGQNRKHVFHPLNLNHKLNTNKRRIKDFLVKNKFEKINGEIDIEFSDEIFFQDTIFENPIKKNALINKSWNDEGYWLIKEIEQNFFLIFTLDQTADNNIFQIISIDDCRMELLQLQEPEFKNAKITELKTCL
ncbi:MULTISPECIES: hypothetical protein [Leeuwenhoekiella]|uniref:hypothetical protein n=1 Tax=Leeuwenhoekiella TaxID=283735 RepID=UPI000E94B59F|nr:hypothetical protein [Leeuwenhoekiella blandensis]HBT09970.1 hypothetical protein [Leeuwenhoekiella sp.]